MHRLHLFDFFPLCVETGNILGTEEEHTWATQYTDPYSAASVFTHTLFRLISFFSRPNALWRTMGFGSMDLHKKKHCMKLCDQHPKNGKNCYCYKFMRNLSLCIVWYCLILFGIVWNCLVLYGVAPNQTQPKQI